MLPIRSYMVHHIVNVTEVKLRIVTSLFVYAELFISVATYDTGGELKKADSLF